MSTSCGNIKLFSSGGALDQRPFFRVVPFVERTKTCRPRFLPRSTPPSRPGGPPREARRSKGARSRFSRDDRPAPTFLMPLDSHGVLVRPRRCRPSKPIVRKFPILHITAATSIFDAGAHSLRFFALCQNVSKAWLGILEGGIGSRRSLQCLLCFLLGLPSPDKNARPGRPMRDPRRTLTAPMTL